MSNERDGAIHIRPAAEADEALLAELAARLTAFDVPPWRRPADIATADAREMMDAVRAESPDNEVLIAERAGVPVGCLHILATTDFFGARHAHISVIATTEAAEGSGVGQALLRACRGMGSAPGLPAPDAQRVCRQQSRPPFLRAGGLVSRDDEIREASGFRNARDFRKRRCREAAGCSDLHMTAPMTAPTPKRLRQGGLTYRSSDVKYMLMMHAPRTGWKDAGIGTWPPDDIKAHISFMHAFQPGADAGRRAGRRPGVERARGGQDRARRQERNTRRHRRSVSGSQGVPRRLLDCRLREQGSGVQLAARVSAAPGKGGVPLNMPVEVREVMSAPPVDM